jgi:hypothetical protein
MIFLRKLPEGVTKKELKNFIKTTVKELDSRPFSLKTAVCNCSILCISDPESGTREYHGLVEVQPATAAMRAIEALNGKRLRGQPVEVRRYRHRSPLRDPREGLLGYALGESWGGDRRRQNVKIDLISA